MTDKPANRPPRDKKASRVVAIRWSDTERELIDKARGEMTFSDYVRLAAIRAAKRKQRGGK